MNTISETSVTNTPVSAALSSGTSMTDAQKKIQALKARVAANTASSHVVLEQAKVGESAIPFLAFTPDHEDVNIHWVDTQEKKGYIQCNGNGCPLCRAGNKRYSRLLIPGFNFNSREVEVLAITDACNPGAALPQILPVFDAIEPTMMLISRQRNKYTVDLKTLPENIDIGQAKIEAFNTAYANGEVKLSNIFEKCSNEELTALPSIQILLQCYGHTAA